MSFYHKVKFSNPYIFANQCRRPLIFQTMNSVKYKRFSLSGWKNIGIGKVEFVAKTQFL